MRILNENLAKYTTMKVGGNAGVLSIPESELELIDDVKHCSQHNIPYRILGNGSNILISDEGVKSFVINNKRACTDLFIKDGFLYCGSSVMLQKLIDFCLDNELYAMEYLYSVPATLGGAIVQNAGRGRQYNNQISDHLVKVKVFNGEKIIEMSKDECLFRYRHSIFKNDRDLLVLGAYFELPKQCRSIGEKAKKERMDLVNIYQDRGYPNCGSIFCDVNSYIMRLLRGVRFGNAGFSKKTPNWICNYGDATFRDIVLLINLARFVHKLLFLKIESEVEMWS